MHLIIPELISARLAAELCTALAGAEFIDGGASAGAANRELKHNLELFDMSRLPAAACSELMSALRGNRSLETWAMPRRSTPLVFNRFDAGMYYRDHVDAPVGIIDKERHRSDLSMTLFLSPPDAYDGGELVLDSDGPGLRVKLAAGHAVVYPTGVLHRVEPVTRGTRLAVVTWIESTVRGHAERQLLCDLTRVRDGLGADAPPLARRLLDKCIVNLTRMWAG